MAFEVFPTRSRFPWTSFFLFLGFAWFMAAVGLYFFLKPYAKEAAQIDLSLLDNYDISSVFYDREGGELGRIFTENRLLLDEKEPIPPLIQNALIAAEDRRFFQHHGLDWRGLLRAAASDLKHHHIVQGGSTLTQQLAKHLINNFNRSFERKIYEMFVAVRLEHHYSKEQILRYYLNRVYFGNGYFGIEAAAEGYFGKHAGDLSLGQAALLAGVVRAPNHNSPRFDIKRSTRRRDMVLSAMVEMKLITPVQAHDATVEPLGLIPERNRGMGDSFLLAAVRQELDQLFAGTGTEEMPQGLRIETSIDPALQTQAARLNETLLAQMEKRMLSPNPSAGPLESAAVILDGATGAIRVFIGGRDFKRSQFDRATQARREAPALLQPFLYAQAMGNPAGPHLDPASLLNASFFDLDQPSADAVAGNRASLPNGRWITLQDALTVGSPYAAARVELQMGPPMLSDWLATALNRPMAGREKPFWKREPLTLLENAALYQILANDGVRATPHFIERILNQHGEVLFDRAERANETALAVLDPLTAEQIALTLQPATQEGIARSLTDEFHFPLPVAGMASYSTGYRDAAFAGFAGGLVGAVWVGYDDSKPLGSAQIASETALPLWNGLMRAALPEVQSSAPLTPVPIPDALQKYEINRQTGALLGPGHLSPARGDVFVYLTEAQMKAASERVANAPASSPGSGWSDWLGTLLADDSSSTTLSAPIAAPDRGAIPAQATYRLPALRGNILTAEGNILATMRQAQTLALPWPGLNIAPDAASAIAWVKSREVAASQWLGLPIDISDDRLAALYTYQRFQPLILAEDLTAQQITDFPKSGLPELSFALQGFPERAYPEHATAAHLVGYLRRLQARNTGRYQADEVIYGDYGGAAGLEAVFDSTLRGTDGKMALQTTPDGFTEMASVTTPATVGKTIRTTLREPIQEVVEGALDSVPVGAMVILDVRTGDIVAMASRPNFDPNEFIPAVSPENWARLSDPAMTPLVDRAALEQQPPGSVFKTITTLAAIRAGVLDPEAEFETDGTFRVGNIEYTIPEEAGTYNFRDAFAHSINIYFFNLSLSIGRDNLIAAAHDMGVGKPTGFILDEAPGRMPDNAFVVATHQRNMGPGDVTNTAIGQGDVLMTPLQMAVLAEAIANNGVAARPRLVADVEDGAGNIVQQFPPQPYLAFVLPPGQEGGWQILHQAMEAVAQEGTGKLGQPDSVHIAAKTGTAQVGSKDQPRQIAWFAGYVPAEQPQYAFAIMVEGKPSGDIVAAHTSAPIARQVFDALYGKAERATPVPQ